MLSNIELEELADNYGVSLNTIVMKDELKGIQPRNGNFIINLQSSTEGNGTHWILAVIKNKNCFYFDPFGILPPTEIIDFCKRIPDSTLAYSTKEIQNISAETCGWFGLGLLIYIKRSKNQDIYLASGSYLKLFSEDTEDNNKILIKYFKSLKNTKKIPLLQILYKQK